VFEEIIFRGALLAGLKRIWPRRNNKSKAAPMRDGGDDVPLIFGYTPWVLISSILFACAHIHNHFHDLPTLLQSTLESRERITISVILGAIQQTLSAGYLSFRVLSPAFEANGLAASIGAHFWWNLNVNRIILPIRIIQGVIYHRRNKGSMDTHDT
jgi:membrane protease YdiL (CAAX protease family)